MKKFSRNALTVLVAALSAAMLVTSIAVAENTLDTAAKKKKKKPVLTSKQKSSINKMIDAKVKAIQIPAGPAAYTTSNGAQVDLDSDLDEYKNVLTKAVPAGKYAVSGRVNGFYITDAVDDEANIVCRAKVNGVTVQTGQASNDAGIFLLLASGGTLNTSFNFTVDAAAASTITVDCAAGYNDPGSLQGVYVPVGFSDLTAITVSSIG